MPRSKLNVAKKMDKKKIERDNSFRLRWTKPRIIKGVKNVIHDKVLIIIVFSLPNVSIVIPVAIELIIVIALSIENSCLVLIYFIFTYFFNMESKLF